MNRLSPTRILLPVIPVFCALLVAFFADDAVAQARPSEYAVKAAYLLNFGRFVKWPSDHQGSFNICVLGRDPFGGELDRTVAGESVSGHPVAVRRLDSTHDAGACAILFIGTTERSRLASILEELRHKPVLTVSDMPDFVDRGGIIQFEIQQDRVRFDVNRAAAREAGLTLSSDLLKVAARVEEK